MERIVCKKICLIGVIFYGANILANENNSYICIAQQMVGFSFIEKFKEWKGISGDADADGVLTDVFLVRPVKPDDRGLMGGPLNRSSTYGIWLMGEEGPPFVSCDEGFSKHHWLKCGMGYSINFRMNARTMRYMLSLDGDYFISTFNGVEDTGGNPMTMQIGSCNKI